MSILINPSLYPLLIVGAAMAAAAIYFGWFRRPAWALYTAIFVAVMPSGSLGYVPAYIESIINRSTAVVALVVWVFAVITQRDRVKWTITTLLMLGFLIWASVTLSWAGNLGRGGTTLGVYALRFMLFLLLVPSVIRTKENLDGLMHTLALSGWVLLVVSTATILLEGYTPGTRFSLLGMNVNRLGIHTLVTLPGVLWLAIQPENRHNALWKVMASIFLLMTISLIAVTGSRGSSISLFIILLAFWFWKPTRPWGIFGLGMVALGVVLAPFVFTTILERFAVREAAGDTLLGGRENLWQYGWQLITKQPLLGVGIGNSPLEMMALLGPSELAWQFDGRSIHNPIMAIWCETGIAGIILYLGVLMSAVWSFFRQYQEYRRRGMEWLMPYFALVVSVFLGYMASWVKDGGGESTHTFFLMVALLLIPSCLDTSELPSTNGVDAQHTCTSKKRMEARDLQPTVA